MTENLKRVFKNIKTYIVFFGLQVIASSVSAQIEVTSYIGVLDSVPDEIVSNNNYSLGFFSIEYGEQTCMITLNSDPTHVIYTATMKTISPMKSEIGFEGESVEIILCLGLFDTIEIQIYGNENITLYENNHRTTIYGQIKISKTNTSISSTSNSVYNPNRKVVTPPVMNYTGTEEGRIALDIWIDELGNVVRCEYKESKSTSGSQILIDVAKTAAKTMKYEKKPGAGIEYVGYQIFEIRKN